MSRPQTFFHGTETEADALESAVTHNCGCAFDEAGVMNDMCVPHRMMLNDQRALDGMLFMKRMAESLIYGEWNVEVK